MLLALDLGNTDLVFGVIDDDKVIETYRTTTNTMKSNDEYAYMFMTYLKDYKDQIDGIIVSSVVPSLNHTLKSALQKCFNLTPLFVETGIKTGLKIRIDNPSELGADLVCDCVGALHKYGSKTIVVDLGTATKVLVIDEHGALIGGMIGAGLKISLEALVGKTAKLNEISLQYPRKIIGKNTVECMNSGIVLGTKLMIEGAVFEIEKQLGYKMKKIITGGFSYILDNLEGFIYDHNLILDGLNIIYKKNNE